MTNPTSAFGWQMPTSTDLVTDLPADFEVFGQAVDTSLADLKGGTTGQVLSKATNADMDFTWVAQDDSNAIQNAIVDAKGDLIAASAADTPARLAVGNNGETLVADSSTSTGLRYTAGTVQSNPVINSAFQVWQRSTSISVPTNSYSYYTADRWALTNGSANPNAATVSRQATGDTTNLPSIQYCARIQRNSGQTSTSGLFFINSFETINTIPFVGKTITVSFYARKGANYSPSADSLTLRMYYGTGTDQNPILTPYTGATTVDNAVTLTSTWQRFNISLTVPTTATEMSVGFVNSPTGTAGAADFYELTGVQIDIGSVALPFRTNGGTIQGELAACQRYYWRFGGQDSNQIYGLGIATGTTTASIPVQNPVTMRTAPTSIDFSTLGTSDLTAFTNAITTLTISVAANNIVRLSASGGSGMTIKTPVTLQNTAIGGYLGISAEL